ncbi:MAG: hypothetical protein ACR5LC_13965 [Symbiopectobacterium sp.]|uniref:hypothetical protein n=1 Tax=Symbiopectobacterium sp. TaxID=2952789 RepID=UPI003F3BD834
MLKSVFLFFISTVLVGCSGSAPLLDTPKTEYCKGLDCKPEPHSPESTSGESYRYKTTVPVDWSREEKLDLPKNWLSDREQKKRRDTSEISN